jgi:hypothetical protein
MTPDAIIHTLLILWVGALVLLLARLFLLRLHKAYILFTVSTALDIVFGIATLQSGISSQGAENLALLGDTMDIFLTPSVAVELISMPGTGGAYSSRYLSVVLFMLLAGAGITMFLAGSPDKDSFEAATSLAYIADTMMTLFVISFLLRRLRLKDLTADHNTQWLRRLFLIQLSASAIHSLLAPFLPQSAFNIVDILFFSVSLAATLLCTLRLRKAPAA